MFSLPSVIKTHIYEYDDTYRIKFLHCIKEISILNTKYIAHQYFATRLFGVKEDIHSLELFSNYFTYKHKNVPYMIQIHHHKDNEYDLYDNSIEMWAPIANVYSPPFGHYYSYFYLQPEHVPLIGKIIGKNGKNFKAFTQYYGASYIWYNKTTNSIEIWAPEPSRIMNVYSHLIQYICHVSSRNV